MRWAPKIDKAVKMKLVVGLLIFAAYGVLEHNLEPVFEPLAYSYLATQTRDSNPDELPIVVSLDFLYGDEAGKANPKHPISSNDYKELFKSLRSLCEEGYSPSAIRFDIDFSLQESSKEAQNLAATSQGFLTEHVDAVDEAKQFAGIPGTPKVFFGVGRQAFRGPQDWWIDVENQAMFANLTAPSRYPLGNLENITGTKESGHKHLPSMGKALGNAFLDWTYPNDPHSKTFENIWKTESDQVATGVIVQEFLVDYSVIPAIAKVTIYPTKNKAGEIVFSANDKKRLKAKMVLFGQTTGLEGDLLLLTQNQPSNSLGVYRGIYAHAASANSYARNRIMKLPRVVTLLIETLIILLSIWVSHRLIGRNHKQSELNKLEKCGFCGIWLVGSVTAAGGLVAFVFPCFQGVSKYVVAIPVLGLILLMFVYVVGILKAENLEEPERRATAAIFRVAIAGVSLAGSWLLLRLPISILHLSLFAGILFTLLEPIFEPILESVLHRFRAKDRISSTE